MNLPVHLRPDPSSLEAMYGKHWRTARATITQLLSDMEQMDMDMRSRSTEHSNSPSEPGNHSVTQETPSTLLTRFRERQLNDLSPDRDGGSFPYVAEESLTRRWELP